MIHHVAETEKPFDIAKFALGDTFACDGKDTEFFCLYNGYALPSSYTPSLINIRMCILGKLSEVSLTEEEIEALYFQFVKKLS